MPVGQDRWQDLTAPELASRMGPETVAVMVLGAVEQHGPHLPLSTDLDIGLGLLTEARRHLPADFPLLVMPPLALGSSEEHGGFPGTLSLPPQTAVAVLEALGEGVSRAGGRRLVWLNAHGGNTAVMDQAALALRRRHGLLVIKATYTRLGQPPGIDADEWRHGLHGGALETALMRHLAPERVREDQVRDFPGRGQYLVASGHRWLGPEGAGAFAWLAEDLHPDGVTGDAAAGTAELGARILGFYGERLAQLLQEAASLPWDARPAPGPRD
ncbi:creatininase family protein [Ectothiorhodospira haloalkaliphila]|uniref:creatininase family protein n=1 Tax=Ectothiorhodospira haloalkaliphila TaxID=421628 RepID=UPI001EE887BD|nr:creatininase family protein [Ectothiorhodospira haloalkaliphila]MCG5523640.1 creatininase family protein [Ectothiorhodospira haloalkaliphila]